MSTSPTADRFPETFRQCILHRTHTRRRPNINIIKHKFLSLIIDTVDRCIAYGKPKECNLPAVIIFQNKLFNHMGKDQNARIDLWHIFFHLWIDDCRGLIVKSFCDHVSFSSHSSCNAFSTMLLSSVLCTAFTTGFQRTIPMPTMSISLGFKQPTQYNNLKVHISNPAVS